LWVPELLDAWQPTVIKGNAAEIGALADSDEVCPCDNSGTHTENKIFCLFLLKVKAQGVDSLGGFENAANVVRTLARTHSS
jgi:thiamine-phosphate diphosphorylase/hydroxyethylthiazole kinase